MNVILSRYASDSFGNALPDEACTMAGSSAYTPVATAEGQTPLAVSVGNNRRRVMLLVVIAVVLLSSFLLSSDYNKDGEDNNRYQAVRNGIDDPLDFPEKDNVESALTERSPANSIPDDGDKVFPVDDVDEDTTSRQPNLPKTTSSPSKASAPSQPKDEKYDEIDADDEKATSIPNPVESDEVFPVDDDVLEEEESTTEDPSKPVAKDAFVGERCTYWKKTFRKRFMKECEYWLDVYNEWENSIGPKTTKEVSYLCNGNLGCHGWGDRISGMLTAFNRAVDEQSQFKIGHEYVKDMFSPCVVGRQKATDWSRLGYTTGNARSCYVGDVACSHYQERTCPKPALVSVNPNRLCLGDKHCTGLMAMKKKKVSAASAVGCGLRAMLEPSRELFETTKFPLKVEGHTRSLSLKEIQELLQTYYVISIQMRLGDAISFTGIGTPFDMQSKKRMLFVPFRCAQTVESYLRTKQKQTREYEEAPDMTIHKKQVRYFLATDSLEYKEMAAKQYGDKLITFDFKPEHIGLSGSKKASLAREIAEWYTLGLGNQLILNKNGGSPNSLLYGRYSGFGKSTWAYHLKHMIYDARTCLYSSLPFEGTWDSLNNHACGDSLLMRKQTAFDQSHLQPLYDQNVSFPGFYVVNGVVLNTQSG